MLQHAGLLQFVAQTGLALFNLVADGGLSSVLRAAQVLT